MSMLEEDSKPVITKEDEFDLAIDRQEKKHYPSKGKTARYVAKKLRNIELQKIREQ